MSRRRALAAALFAACALGAPSARSEPSREDVKAAQKLFDEGLDLLEHGHAAEACPKLEASQRLDPGMGTAFRLGECYAATARLVRAGALFREVAVEARAANNGAREQVAMQRAVDVEARTPKLVLDASAASRVPGLVVRVDGAEVTVAEPGAPMPLDPGDHTVSASAPGFGAWSARLHLDEGTASRLSIPALSATGGEPKAHPAPSATASAPPPASSFGGQRVAALAVASVGVAGLALGTAFGLEAKSKWHDTLAHCNGGRTDQCDSTGVALGGDAKTAATVSTVSFVVAGAGLAGAAILFFTAPSSPRADAVRVTPIAGLGTVGAACTGAF